MKIFISYRREDTGPAAGRVYDRLCKVMAKSDVFFDVSAVRGGENFEDKIAAAIAKSGAVLVLIGRHWLDAQEGAKPRLFEPRDYVRAELRAALAREVLLVPILVDGARMPAPESLPDDVRPVTARNAVPLRHEAFDDDVEAILRAIFGGEGKDRPWEETGGIASKIWYALAGSAAALVLVLVAALIHHGLLARPLSASIGPAGTTLLLIVSAVAGAFGGWFYRSSRARRRRAVR
jgi:TIR domain